MFTVEDSGLLRIYRNKTLRPWPHEQEDRFKTILCVPLYVIAKIKLFSRRTRIRLSLFFLRFLTIQNGRRTGGKVSKQFQTLNKRSRDSVSDVYTCLLLSFIFDNSFQLTSPGGLSPTRELSREINTFNSFYNNVWSFAVEWGDHYERLFLLFLLTFHV